MFLWHWASPFAAEAKCLTQHLVFRISLESVRRLAQVSHCIHKCYGVVLFKFFDPGIRRSVWLISSPVSQCRMYFEVWYSIFHGREEWQVQAKSIRWGLLMWFHAKQVAAGLKINFVLRKNQCFGNLGFREESLTVQLSGWTVWVNAGLWLMREEETVYSWQIQTLLFQGKELLEAWRSHHYWNCRRFLCRY